MRWPWHRVPEVPVPDDNRGEAHDALTKSQKDLADIHQQGPEVRKIARSLREIRETNHLAEQLRQALGGQ